MKSLKNFRIVRRAPEWRYLLQFEDSEGRVVELAVTFEDLDRMAVAIDEQMLAIVEAAGEREG
ncbi:MAG: hypothetical protein WC997_15195 [Porticoccaceae bacterium]